MDSVVLVRRAANILPVQLKDMGLLLGQGLDFGELYAVIHGAGEGTTRSRKI